MTKLRNRNRFAAMFALECLEGRKLLSTTTVELSSGAADVSTFDSKGHLTGFTATDAGGNVQFEQTNHYNAQGNLTSREDDYGSDFGVMAGATEIETFSGATGHMTSYTETLADGSMYTATYNSTGAETSSAAFDGDGNLTSQQMYLYSPTGSLASVTDTNADGSSTKTVFYADEHVSSITDTAADGTATTHNFRDLTSGTWNDEIE